jgi:hypothetical protein
MRDTSCPDQNNRKFRWRRDRKRVFVIDVSCMALLELTDTVYHGDIFGKGEGGRQKYYSALAKFFNRA